jgi:hypothetical protein
VKPAVVDGEKAVLLFRDLDIGEWNNVERVKVEETDNEGVKSELYKIDAGASDLILIELPLCRKI